ncbi:MAG TPA: RNA polymerase subunit sigma-70, partial [Bacteroidales bacterium]|nr:RNA polymerase subunit sigma-70 [Bacteroidales bacterium]
MQNQVLLQAANGNHKAQKQLYLQHANRLMLVCRRYVSNNTDAESIVNSGFYKIFNHLKNFKNEHENSFDAWSKQIIINEALRFLETNKQNLFTSEIPDTDTDNRHADSDLVYEDYLNLLAKLPQGFRTVFSLFAIDGYNHKEIAEQLNITEST